MTIYKFNMLIVIILFFIILCFWFFPKKYCLYIGTYTYNTEGSLVPRAEEEYFINDSRACKGLIESVLCSGNSDVNDVKRKVRALLSPHGEYKIYSPNGSLLSLFPYKDYIIQLSSQQIRVLKMHPLSLPKPAMKDVTRY